MEYSKVLLSLHSKIKIMKKIIFTLLIINVLCSCSKTIDSTILTDANANLVTTPAASKPITITDSCVLYMPFNKDTKDYSTYNNNGINYGTTLVPDRFGKDSSARKFTGTSYIQIASSPSISFDSTFSLNSWINIPSYIDGINADQMRILSKERSAGGTGYAYGIDRTGLLVNSFNNDNTNFINNGTSVIPINTWTMVTFVYDGKTVKSYVNGVLKSQSTITVTLLNSNLSLFIGKEFDDPHGGAGYTNRYFNGIIDDVRLYRKPLSDKDINTLYNLKQ